MLFRLGLASFAALVLAYILHSVIPTTATTGTDNIMPYEAHQAVAERAVRAAAYLTSSVFDHLGTSDKLDKSDASPVTVGDFGSQAIIISLLAQAFPEIPVVGEEDATALRGDAPDVKQLRDHVTSLARQSLSLASLRDPPTETDLPQAQLVAQAVSSNKFTDDELLDAIDQGNYEGGPKGRTYLFCFSC